MGKAVKATKDEKEKDDDDELNHARRIKNEDVTRSVPDRKRKKGRKGGKREEEERKGGDEKQPKIMREEGKERKGKEIDNKLDGGKGGNQKEHGENQIYMGEEKGESGKKKKGKGET